MALTVVLSLSFKEDHPDADSYDCHTKNPPECVIGEAYPKPRTNQGSQNESGTDQGCRPEIHKPLFVLCPPGKESNRRNKQCQGGPLRLMLSHAE
jgi:hypothetical protein